MPGVIQPSRGDVHVNKPLGNISIAYIQEQSDYVADKVFPNIPVSKQSDVYFTYDKGDFLRDTMQVRAPGSESAGDSYKVANSPYYTTVRAIHKDIPDQVRSNSDSPLNMDADATRFVTQKGLLRRELLWGSLFFVDAVWTFNADGNATRTAAGSFDPTHATNNRVLFWDDAASTPIEDIRQGKRYVQSVTGFRPNKLTLSRETFDILVDHPDIVGRMDRGQTTGAAMVNKEAMAALFELDEVLVMDGVYNSAAEGATDALAFIGGKHALLSFSPAAASLLTPSAGYSFSWTGFLGASDLGIRIKKMRMEIKESDRIEAQMAHDPKLIAADLGYMFVDVIQ